MAPYKNHAVLGQTKKDGTGKVVLSQVFRIHSLKPHKKNQAIPNIVKGLISQFVIHVTKAPLVLSHIFNTLKINLKHHGIIINQISIAMGIDTLAYSSA
jgi:hypothetical protein